MSKRRHDFEIVALSGHSGYGPAHTYAVIRPEPPYHDEGSGRLLEDPVPCMLDCDDKDCKEWPDVWHLQGETRTEAITALLEGRYSGYSHHVSECEMRDVLE